MAINATQDSPGQGHDVRGWKRHQPFARFRNTAMIWGSC